MSEAVHRTASQALPRRAVICCLIAVCLSLSALVGSTNAGEAATCNALGDRLVDQEQWTAAVAAYRKCSKSHGDQGPVAAWSMYKSYHVLYWHIKDKQLAGSACEAGWQAYNAPELAWCAGFVASYTNRLKEAMEWSKRAIAVGCFQGSCNSLFTKQPDPWSNGGIANVEICSWEGPFDVMYWACKGLGNAACAQETHQRVYQAKFAREAYGKHMDLYQATKSDVSVPRGPALRDASQCGKRTLLQRPQPAGHYEPQLHVVTFATDLDKPELGELLTSAKAHGVRVTILQPRFDLRGFWGGRFGLRLQLVTNFANLIPDDDIVMFVDGYDVIFTGNASSIIDGYYRATKGREMALFAAETAVWPEKELESVYPPGPTRYQYLNAGTWMGTAHAVRCVMSAINLTFDDHGFLFTDDQFVFANVFLETYKTDHPLIALDYNVDVFASLYDKTQGGFDSFVPRDWECVEGKGYTFKLTGGVPKVFHASGNQGQHWMQREILPHSIRSGELGRPAACGMHAAAGQQQQGMQGDGVEVRKIAPGLSHKAFQQQQQQQLQQQRQHGGAGGYTPLPRLTATAHDLKWQLLIAAVGMAMVFTTAALRLAASRGKGSQTAGKKQSLVRRLVGRKTGANTVLSEQQQGAIAGTEVLAVDAAEGQVRKSPDLHTA